MCQRCFGLDKSKAHCRDVRQAEAAESLSNSQFHFFQRDAKQYLLADSRQLRIGEQSSPFLLLNRFVVIQVISRWERLENDLNLKQSNIIQSKKK